MLKNNKGGFTLVELLATMVILGLIMVVAVPNVIGILSKNRANTYVEYAKKMATLAEYQLRTGNNLIEKPSANNCVVISLSYIDNSEFEDPPNGGEYLKDQSFVVIKKDAGEFKYYVRLVEKFKDTNRGVKLTESSELYKEGAANSVVDNFTSSELISLSDMTTSDFKTKYSNTVSTIGCGDITKIYAY